jgi:mediator of RNA polymerase II transcription subunit 7
MASDRENAVFTENLPPPPPFWEHFTAQNVENVKALLEEGRPVPPNLRHLIPPLPPSDGKYRSFGEMHDVCLHGILCYWLAG